jgi:hypothetical protein
MMLAESTGSETKAARRKMIALLHRARGRKVFHLTNKGLAALAKAFTDNRQASSRRSASRPRIGRK